MFKNAKALLFNDFFLSRYDIVCSGKHITVSIILKININCITDFDYHNGHLCFECDQQLSPDNCDQVTLCDQDSVSFSEKHKSGLTQYQSILCLICLVDAVLPSINHLIDKLSFQL